MSFEHLLPVDRSSRVVRSIRHATWTAGEFVHRRLPDRVSNIGNGSGSVTGDVERVRPISPADVGAIDDHRPFQPEPAAWAENPVLTARDVTDYGNPNFVADPFLLVSEDEGWNLFFEVFNSAEDPTAVIAHATSEDGGQSWDYNRVVLQEDTHLAFPYVFEWNNSFYMVPDRWDRESPAAVRIYRTERLPDEWKPVATIVRPNRELADCVTFRWNDRWWAILGRGDKRHELFVYHADDLVTDGWTPHEKNPVVTGRPRTTRPGGRPIVGDDRILFFFQDCAARYGDKVRVFEIERLSPSEYADRECPESPILEGTNRRLGWNSGRMHHIDPFYTTDGWICAVDGNIGFGQSAFGDYHWSIGIYQR